MRWTQGSGWGATAERKGVILSKNLGTVFECHNKACSLGSRVDPGRFTGGITAEQKNLLTGEPVEKMVEGKDYGEGVCASCGELGTPTDEEQVSLAGTDPNQDLHNEIASRVADEDDSLTARGAQTALISVVKEREQGDLPVEGDGNENQ